MLDLSVLGEISDTALTREVEIATTSSGLPNTFVPGRNIVFLTFAAAVAYRRGLKHVVTGVCETDFSGYPDCRDDTIKALQVALNLGMQSRFVLETPLMWIDKAADLVACRKARWGSSGRPDPRPDVDLLQWRHRAQSRMGRGCGGCPACDLRARGYQKYRPAARETADA